MTSTRAAAGGPTREGRTMASTTTYTFAQYVTWMGHVSATTAASMYAADEISAALSAGLVESSRLGGYVATRKGNAREFGDGFNQMVDRLVES